MCMLCVEIQKERMNLKETARAFREMTVPESHQDEIMEVIQKQFGADKFLEAYAEQLWEQASKEELLSFSEETIEALANLLPSDE